MPFYEVTVRVLVEGPADRVRATEKYIHALVQEYLPGADMDEAWTHLDKDRLHIVGASVVEGATKTHAKAG
jgi:hypothetical protein